jgi:hypothetical protein
MLSCCYAYIATAYYTNAGTVISVLAAAVTAAVPAAV